MNLRFHVNSKSWVAQLPKEVQDEIKELRGSEAKYKKLDDSVLFAIYVFQNVVLFSK